MLWKLSGIEIYFDYINKNSHLTVYWDLIRTLIIFKKSEYIIKMQLSKNGELQPATLCMSILCIFSFSPTKKKKGQCTKGGIYRLIFKRKDM